MDDCDVTTRHEALALLETFAIRVLPSTVRRIARWKRISRRELPDLFDDVRQELALDCLLHATTVAQLPTEQRHSRWMRLAERWVYHQRYGRRRIEQVTADMPAPQPSVAAPPSPTDDVPTVSMGNGRVNLVASAARNRKKVRGLRKELELRATRLGYGGQYHAFWRVRLAEALTGLAADLLRDRNLVRLLRRPRSAPDPRGRLRRIRRISARFHVRPSTIDVRRVLRYWVRRPQLDAGAPRRMLEHATQLCPTKASTWLWLFEASLVDRDLAAAARAIRTCRQLPACPRLGVTLARARILEVRGRWQAATSLLRRAKRRWPLEPHWHLVPAAVTAVQR